MKWPGLSREVASLCKQLGLQDAAKTKMSKYEYQKDVKEACRMMDERNMKKEMEKMKDKKMKVMMKEGCEIKDCVKKGNIYTARKVWEAKCYMLRVAGNYPGTRGMRPQAGGARPAPTWSGRIRTILASALDMLTSEVGLTSAATRSWLSSLLW